MRAIAVASVASLALAACGKSKPPPAADDPWAAPTPAAPPAGEPAPPAHADFLALATASRKPALIGPFARLHLAPTLTIADARDVAPDLFAKPLDALDWFESSRDEYPGIRFRVQRVGQIDFDPDQWFVGILRVVMPAAGVRERLTAAWGPPRVYRDGLYWYDPAAGLRARLGAVDPSDVGAVDRVYLDFQGYLPLALLLAPAGDHFAFEGDAPLVGARTAEVARRFGHRVYDDGDALHLWPTEVGPYTTVHLGAFGDTPDPITGYRLEIDGDDGQLARLLTARFGKPKDFDDDAGLGHLYRKQAPRIVDRGDALEVGTPPDF